MKFQVPALYFLYTHLCTYGRAINNPLTVHPWSIFNSLILPQAQCSFWWSQLSWRLVSTRATKAVCVHDTKLHFFLSSLSEQWLCISQAPRITYHSRRDLRPLTFSTIVTRPTPWAPRAPSGLTPSSRPCRCQLLLVSSCSSNPLFSKERWQGREGLDITSEIQQAWVCDHWKRTKATGECHHGQIAVGKWRIPMWTSWQRCTYINRSDIVYEWEICFPHFSNH